MIFNIQKFATQDGNGVRTVVFFKGCPLRCLWCSNPESQSFDHELMYEKVKCISCMECVNASKNGEVVLKNNAISIDNSKKIESARYTDLCPAKALNVVGEARSIDEIMAEVLKDKIFYENSDGGVTISGGEPFAQPEMLSQLLTSLKENDISVFIETCLHVRWKNIKPSLDKIDCILADLKHVNADKYKKFTGGDVNIPLNNLKNLSLEKVNVRFRIPIIPGFNDSLEEMTEILDFAASLKTIKDVDLIPYHRFGKGKYKSLFREFIFKEESSEIPQDKLDTFLKMCNERNLNAEILI